ncbi:MAG: NAD(P)/FAD-dependent oxidoreductase [Clostridiales bacterium]|jgi:dihydrolipoamide dehydrogenase|nr:NAD(P)/FAD-dependent oxidoreductase [Clostridiales bacterium]
MEEGFDLAVVGAGPGGYTAALKAAKRGMRVVMFEENEVGGTCLNAGCIPTKALLDMAKTYAHLKRAEYITGASAAAFDVGAADAKKNAAVDKIRESLVKYLTSSKITIVKGRASLTGKNGVECGGKKYFADNIIIASGSKHALYNIDGIEAAYSSDKLTRRFSAADEIIVVGGGAAGLEFAWLYRQIGRGVSVVMMEERPLVSCDKDISAQVALFLKKSGIRLYCGATVRSVAERGGGFCVVLEREGRAEEISGDMVVDASGRRPNVDGMGLSLAGVRYDGGGIYTDENFETDAKGVYAVGDAVRGNVRLAHKAMSDAEAAVSHILSGASARGSVVPSCVYLSPEISCAGMTQEACAAVGAEFAAAKSLMGANGKAVACDSDTGFFKVIFAKIDDGKKASAGVEYMPERANLYRLVGVHIFAEGSSEIIGAAAALIAMGATADDILKTPFPHPSLSEAFREAVALAKRKISEASRQS